MTPDPTELQRISDRYATFAVDEAKGASEIYERLALAIAASPELLAFIAGLPSDRRQPNLFLAAVRQYHSRIRSVMLSRTTQTNEPARCSGLLPLLARLPQPLALLEIGA